MLRPLQIDTRGFLVGYRLASWRHPWRTLQPAYQVLKSHLPPPCVGCSEPE